MAVWYSHSTMHMHKAEPFYTFAAIDPVALAVYDDPSCDRPREHFWVSRKDIRADCVWPGNTVQLKYHMFVTVGRYNEERDQYEGVGRKTGGIGGGYKGAVGWMNVMGRSAVFRMLDAAELNGLIAEKMPLAAGEIYNIYGWGAFTYAGIGADGRPHFSQCL